MQSPGHKISADCTEVFDEAIARYNDGKFEESLEAFTAFLQISPNPDFSKIAEYYIRECRKRMNGGNLPFHNRLPFVI